MKAFAGSENYAADTAFIISDAREDLKPCFLAALACPAPGADPRASAYAAARARELSGELFANAADFYGSVRRLCLTAEKISEELSHISRVKACNFKTYAAFLLCVSGSAVCLYSEGCSVFIRHRGPVFCASRAGQSEILPTESSAFCGAEMSLRSFILEENSGVLLTAGPPAIKSVQALSDAFIAGDIDGLNEALKAAGAADLKALLIKEGVR